MRPPRRRHHQLNVSTPRTSPTPHCAQSGRRGQCMSSNPIGDPDRRKSDGPATARCASATRWKWVNSTYAGCRTGTPAYHPQADDFTKTLPVCPQHVRSPPALLRGCSVDVWSKGANSGHSPPLLIRERVFCLLSISGALTRSSHHSRFERTLLGAPLRGIHPRRQARVGIRSAVKYRPQVRCHIPRPARPHRRGAGRDRRAPQAPA